MPRLTGEALQELGLENLPSAEPTQTWQQRAPTFLPSLPSKNVRGYRRLQGEKAAQMLLERYTYDEIAAELGIKVDEVDSLSNEARKSWTQRRLMATADRISEELAHLERIRDEAWDAWERSKSPKVVKERTVNIPERQVLQTVNEDGSITDVFVGGRGPGMQTFPGKIAKRQTTSSVGDPAYLKLAIDISSQIRKLLGIDAPEVKKLQINHNVNVKHSYEELVQMDPSRLEELYRDAITASNAT